MQPLTIGDKPRRKYRNLRQQRTFHIRIFGLALRHTIFK